MSKEKDESKKINLKAGFVGLIGQPNAGKSSLMNALVKQKLAIVTAKPQTTRRRIQGLLTEERGQIIFVDAPGIIKSESGLNMFLEKEALDVIKNSDVLMLVLSIDEKDIKYNEEIIELGKNSNKPCVAVITKTDNDQKAHRIRIIANLLSDLKIEWTTHSTQVSNDEDRESIVNLIFNVLPSSEQLLFDKDLLTTESVRNLAAEIIREKCFEELNQEVPFSVAVQIQKFVEDEICPKLYYDIIVSKDSHKAMVIGQKGSKIKKIGEMARIEIQKMMDVKKVYLELRVVVKENWMQNKSFMKELNYVIKD